MIRAGWLDAAIVALIALAGLAGWLSGTPFITTLATKAAIFALAGIGLNFCLGLGGMISFGHAAFFGIGGYAAGILASHAQSTPLWGWAGSQEMLVIWPVAIASAALAGLVIGALSLRTSGAYFIMVTLAFAQMIYYLAISWPAYGGEDGLAFYIRNRFAGQAVMAPLPFFLIAMGALLAGLAVWLMLARSRFGMVLQAIRQNPQRVAATGIRPFNIRLTAFVISAAITGLAGALYADLNRFVSPAMLSWHMSGEIMIFVILGGVGRLAGPVAGAALFILLEYVMGGLTEFWQIPLGLILLAVVVLAPGGLMGLPGRGGRRG